MWGVYSLYIYIYIYIYIHIYKRKQIDRIEKRIEKRLVLEAFLKENKHLESIFFVNYFINKNKTNR